MKTFLNQVMTVAFLSGGRDGHVSLRGSVSWPQPVKQPRIKDRPSRELHVQQVRVELFLPANHDCCPLIAADVQLVLTFRSAGDPLLARNTYMLHKINYKY